MERRILILLMGVLILVQCSSTGRMSSRDAFGLLDQKAVEINRSGVFRQKTDDTGVKGFFYLISGKGIVLAHPSGFLVGSDFSELSFVKEILSKERGVITQDQGGLVRSVFYRKLSDGSCLCLSIDPAFLSN
jgi:hypothetical protein